MKDITIDKCRWHVDREAPEYKARALENFVDRWTTLLDWMREERLLANLALGKEVADWMAVEIHQSDFTEEGYALVRQCIGTWSPAFGHAKSKRHLIQWKRKLAILRKEEPIRSTTDQRASRVADR